MRQLRVDPLAAPRRGLAQQEARDDDARGGEDERKQDPTGSVSERNPEDEAEAGDEDAARHEELRGDAPGHAGAKELQVDVVWRLLPPHGAMDTREHAGDPPE